MKLFQNFLNEEYYDRIGKIIAKKADEKPENQYQNQYAACEQKTTRKN